MRNKKLITLLGSICLVLVLAALPFMAACPAPPAEEEEVTPPPAEEEEAPPTIESMKLVWASAFSPVSMQTLRDKFFIDYVTEETGGAITFETHWGASMAEPAGHLELVRKGIVDMISGCPMYNPGFFPTNGIPFIFPFGPTEPSISITALRQLFEEFPQAVATFEAQNIKVLSIGVWQHYNLLSKTPIRTLADLKGKKIALGGVQVAWAEPAGAVGIMSPIGQRYTQYQQGLIDCDIISATSQVDTSVYEQAKYLTIIDIGSFADEDIMINLKLFNSLSPEVQKILVEAGLAAESYMAGLANKLNADAIATMEQHGVTVFEMSAEDRLKWVEACPDFPADKAKIMEDAGLPGFDMIKRYQELCAEQGFKWPRQWGIEK